MMPGSSSASWKSTGSGVVPDKFPAGLRVLVVDDDPTCLMIIEKMLKICKYEATVCNRAEIGLKLLRENKNGYDIVLSDVHMPDMDGLKFLEHIGLEMDLPVIMMSADDGNSVVMKGITHGACDYLIKPVRIEALRNIWQHVVRKRKKDFEPLATATSGDDVVDQHQKLPEDVDHSSSANEGHNWKNAKRRKDDEDEDEERDGSSSSKKPRVVWSVELHQQFVAAVNQLGIEKAVPKKILELMNIPGLSRENVASHLQKYRLYLRKLSESQHLGSINNPFMGSPDSGYGSISSLNGHQPMAIGGQLPGQSFSSLQAGILNQSKPQFPNPMTAINQRNLLNFQNTKSPHLLHGIPTNMEPKRLVDLHQSRQPVLMPMVGQSQSQSQIQSRQPVFANGMMTHGGIVPSYNMLNNSGFQDTNFNNGPYSSFKNMGPVGSFLPGDENGAHLNGLGNNQDDLLTAILKPQGSFGQLENEFVFDS